MVPHISLTLFRQSGGGAKLLADGAPCADPAECASTFCADGRCTSGAAGQTCDDAVACADGLLCLDLRCSAPLPDGEGCDEPAQCESTFCANWQCISGAEGQTCDDVAACADGLVCIAALCEPPRETTSAAWNPRIAKSLQPTLKT